MNVFRRLALSAVVSAAVGVPVAGQAQSCPTPPGKDVLLFVDNSSSITNAEFDEAQQAIASIAASVLSRPGYRLAVVNWGCEGGRRTTRDGCRVDLATGSAIPGGWSSNPADFAYAGNNSASNRVCRSFGTNFAGSINRNNCGGANFSVNINDDYAQHGLKILEGVLYSGGTTGGNDSYNQPTLGPSTPTQQLMLIHMTDADPNFGRFNGTSIREMPSSETALGFYHYSNRFKNVRNAVIVGVGIDAAAANAVNRGEVAAFASRGGAATDYDSAHPTALSTQAFDTGTPRIASYSTAYNDATILSAANTAFNATVPACVIVRKQSVGDTGSFSFTGGTNGLPSTLTLDTTTANPRAATGVFLSQFNTPTSITETIPSGWSLSSVGCVNASNANVPVTSNLATGQLTIPAAQVAAGAQLTCTFTNTRVQPNFGTCDARMFLDTVTTTEPEVSTLWNVGYATSPFTFDEMGSGRARNALGYNPVDNYIYGIEFDGPALNELIRVGADGSSANLGAIAGLPSGVSYVAGTFSPSGEYYILRGFGSYNTMYRINVVTRSATLITLSSSHHISDIGWYGGALYGVNVGGRLIRIDPVSGATTDIGSTAPITNSVAVWGMANGLFATASDSDAIYSLDPNTGAATFISPTVELTNGDGANCPTASIRFNADMSVTKTNTPASGSSDLLGDTYVPGETRTYHVVVTNTGSFGAQNIAVSDPVPAGVSASTVSWTCASTSGGAACGAVSGTGALNDTGLDLPPGAVATYQVTMTVPAGFTGNLTNTVTMTKISQGGTRAFTFTGNNGWTSQTLTTTATGVGVTGTAQTLTNPLVATTINEALPSGFQLSNVTCTGMGTGGTVTQGASSFTLNAAAVDAGSNIACTITNAVQSQPAFASCSSGMYLSQSPNINTNTTLYDIVTATNPFTYPPIGQGSNVYNAIGFNPVDNFIYGINAGGGTGNRLIRVGADGSSVDLGPVGGGMATDNWIMGTFSDTGVMYALAGGGSTNLRAIDVQTNTSTLITLSSSVQASDMAWIGGLIYTVQGNGQLRSINPATGVVTNIGSPTAAVDYGAMFGSPTGLFGSANGGGFYSFDLVTGARTLISGSPGSNVNDGASCPTAPIQFSADLSVTKTNTPASGPSDLAGDGYVPGQARTYSVVVTNNGPFGAQNITVSDPVPAGINAATMSWTCASTSGGAACGAASGTGALNDTGLDLPAGAVATYLVTMTVPTGFTGDLVNTVTITPPVTINDTNAANNSATDVDQSVPRLTIRKISVGGVDSFGFSGDNGVQTQTLTTTTAGTAVAGATQTLAAAATVTTIIESTSPATYQVSSIACTGLGTGGTATPDLAARTVVLDTAATAVGASIECTFTNTLRQADIQVVKTASPDPVVTGEVVTYQIVVTNNGPLAADGAVLTDAAGAGQDCTTPSTTAICTATGGASCPSPTVPVSSLLGSGVTIPSLPVGGQVTVELRCTVTATGL